MHFIVSYAPDFAPELTEISLKDFRPLPGNRGAQLSPVAKEDEKILFYETHATFWNHPRRVVITFDPKSFHKSYQDLGKKVQRVRKEVLALSQRHAQAADQANAIESIKTHLAQLCLRLKISPDLFQVNFVPEKGQFRLEFQLDHRQMAGVVRHFGKNILITDREDWGVEEIYDTCVTRAVLGPGLGDAKSSNGGRPYGSAKDNRSLFQKALLPLYHWTDSKIRVHLFVCVAALNYLTLLSQRLAAAGIDMTPNEAMEELRELRTAIYAKDSEGKLKRVLEEVNDQQAAILKTLGAGDFQTLLDALAGRGYQVMGPTLEDGRLIYGEIGKVTDLPVGWTAFQAGGSFHLEPRPDQAFFGFAVGQESWKQFLWPPHQTLYQAQRHGAGCQFVPGGEAVPKFAFVGVRSCELAAMEVQDRIFLQGPHVDPTSIAAGAGLHRGAELRPPGPRGLFLRLYGDRSPGHDRV